jgi:acyl-homoserine lactone synthase
MEIHVVNQANRHLYTDVLEAYFQARYPIFVEELGWRETNTDRVEIDQYDNEDATYLIGLVNGEVMTGTRLYPTSLPHLLSEHFPHLSPDGIVRLPHVAEWTRGFIVPKFREQGHGPIKGQFCGTVMDYCLKEGITQIGGVQDCNWLPLWRRYGWNVIPMGPVTDIDGRKCVAAYFEVTKHARDTALRRGGLDTSLLVHQGPYRPFVTIAEKEQREAA